VPAGHTHAAELKLAIRSEQDYNSWEKRATKFAHAIKPKVNKVGFVSNNIERVAANWRITHINYSQLQNHSLSSPLARKKVKVYIRAWVILLF